MKSRARTLLDKSLDAMLAAIEIYNKPRFGYREEAFAILSINAWELLLKSRILLVNENRVLAIFEYETRKMKNNKQSTKLYPKKNRSGNNISISLFKAYDKLINEYGDTLDPLVRKNLESIVEIRDNAIHFYNKDFDLIKKVHEIGTACVKNYLRLVRQWFGVDITEFNLFLMPIAFIRNVGSVKCVYRNQEQRNLLDYVKEMESKIDDDTTRDFNLSLDVDITTKRVSNETLSVPVHHSDDPDAIPINYQEEDIRKNYPWDYKNLTTRLRARFSNFLVDKRYHKIRKQLEKDKKFCLSRFLDPKNPKSPNRKFYSPNIQKEFDKHYQRSTRRSVPPEPPSSEQG